MNNTDDLLAKMNKYKEDFLDKEGKNSFFKKSQKLDCAKQMSQAFNLSEMIQKTIFIIPNTNKIMIDYTIFKLYACPDNYTSIVNYIINLYDTILTSYTMFEVHLILDSFTISAAERYGGIIKEFCGKCMALETKYSKLTQLMIIYYTPSMVESIATLLKPFIDANVEKRIVLISKADSPGKLAKLFSK
jgi:translation elongation factor EF-G